MKGYVVNAPSPIYIDNGNGNQVKTDMVVIGVRGSLYQKGFGYVIKNIITNEMMTIDVRYWPIHWVTNVISEIETK